MRSRRVFTPSRTIRPDADTHYVVVFRWLGIWVPVAAVPTDGSPVTTYYR